MLLSTPFASLLGNGFSMEESISIIKSAGFDALDMTLTAPEWHTAETDTAEFHARLKEIRSFAEDQGMIFNQAHAPFYNRAITEADPEGCFQNIVRAMKYAAILGVKIIVVHPLQHMTYRDPGVPEQLFELNMEYYARLQKYCEQFGIQIAVENMFQRINKKRIVRSVCSTPEEFCRYMDSLDSKYFTACLDLGHTMLTDEPVSFIHKMGSRIGALHVHDNFGFDDDHQIPFTGILDWEGICSALRSVGYSGDFTFEANKHTKAIPKELQQAAYTMLAATGRHLIRRIQP